MPRQTAAQRAALDALYAPNDAVAYQYNEDADGVPQTVGQDVTPAEDVAPLTRLGFDTGGPFTGYSVDMGVEATTPQPDPSQDVEPAEVIVEPRKANDRNEDGSLKLRSIWDIITDLSKPLPDSFVRNRRQGSTDIRYVAWHDATRILDMYAPGWSYEITNVKQFTIVDRNGNNASKVMMTVRLGIPCLEGMVYREATGNEDDVTTSFGDPFSNSESMALRRAAAKFGLARYLYRG